MVSARDEQLDAPDLRLGPTTTSGAPSTGEPANGRGGVESIEVAWGPGALEEVERQAIRRALEAAGGNRTHAANLLGIRRQSLLRRIVKLGISDIPSRHGRPPSA